MKKYFYFISIFFILQSSLSSQDTIRKMQYGISLAVTPASWFYDDRYGNIYDLKEGISLYPSVDLIASYHIIDKYYLSFNLSNMEKTSASTGGVPYKFRYIIFAPTLGRKFKHWSSGYFITSLGPYIGYIYQAKKGEFDIDDDALRRWEVGMELLINFTSDSKWKKSGFGFQTIKFQVGLNEILYFKTMSVSISVIGFTN